MTGVEGNIDYISPRGMKYCLNLASIEIDIKEKIKDLSIQFDTFYPEKLTYLTEIYNGQCLHFFLHSEVFGTPCTIFERYNPGTFHVFCSAKSPYSYYFWLCIATWSGRWGVSKHYLDFFFILVDRRSLRTKVFMFIIKQKCKTNVST